MFVELLLQASIILAGSLFVAMALGFYAVNINFNRNQREINEKFNISHMETISILKQSRAEMRESRSEMRKFQTEMQAFKDEMRELRRDSQIYLRMIFERVDREKT